MLTATGVRTHKYYAEAHLLNGAVGAVAQVKWEKDDEDGDQCECVPKFETKLDQGGITVGITIGPGSTEVKGKKKAGGGWVTSATSKLESCAVVKDGKEVVSADMIIGQISTEHPAKKYVPRLDFTGTKFVKLKVNGETIEPVFDLKIAGNTPTEQFDEETSNCKDENKDPYLVEYVTWPPFVENARKQGGVANGKEIHCSLVTKIKRASGTTDGHEINVPGFGKISLAELDVRNHFELTMMRLKLEDGREITVGGPGTNGQTKP